MNLMGGPDSCDTLLNRGADLTQRRRKRRNTKRPQRHTAGRSEPATRRSERAEEAPPEIRTGFAAAGRETLAAIADELGPAGLAAMRPVDPEPAPDIEIGQAAAGRETLAAIRGELGETDAGGPRHSLDYEDGDHEDGPPPHRRGGFTSPFAARDRLGPPAVRVPAPAGPQQQDSVPPARPRFRTVGFSEPPPEHPISPDARAPARAGGPAPGRATLDAIEQQLASWAETGKPPKAPTNLTRDEASFDVFEMATFVVRGDLAQLSSAAARRRFVADRLLHRLPVESLDDVDRIDVTPWTVRGTVIVRVWCRVPPP